LMRLLEFPVPSTRTMWCSYVVMALWAPE